MAATIQAPTTGADLLLLSSDTYINEDNNNKSGGKTAPPNITVEQFHRALALRGLAVKLDGEGGIAFTGPKEMRNDGHRAYIRLHREELIADLRAKAEAEEKKRAEEYSARNIPPVDIQQAAQTAWEHANGGCFWSTAGYDLEDFQQAAGALYEAAARLCCPTPTIPSLIRFALDETLPLQSSLLGEIILASDHCPVNDFHAGAVVYRHREIVVVTAEMGDQDLQTYHAHKRALLRHWLEKGGTGWVYEQEVRYWSKQAGREVVEDGSRINLRSIAADAWLPWRVVEQLVTDFVSCGIAKGWTPDQHRRVCLVRRSTLAAQRAAQQRREAAIAHENAYVASGKGQDEE